MAGFDDQLPIVKMCSPLDSSVPAQLVCSHVLLFGSVDSCCVSLLVTFSACHIHESAVNQNVVGFTTFVAKLDGLEGSAFLSESWLCSNC